MSDVIPLPPEVEKELYARGRLGLDARKAGDIKTAEAHYLDAWSVIPEPKLGHDHAASMAVSMTEFYRDTAQVHKAEPWLALAREAYGSGNPSTEFLAATVHFVAGEKDEAFEIFDALYKQYRKRPFQGKDSQYLDFYLAEVSRRKTRS